MGRRREDGVLVMVVVVVILFVGDADRVKLFSP
jgi:hypothetical protein